MNKQRRYISPARKRKLQRRGTFCYWDTDRQQYYWIAQKMRSPHAQRGQDD